MFGNHPIAFILCILLIAAFGLGLLILLVWYLSMQSTRLRIDADQMHLEKGLMSKSHVDLDISHIRTVKVNQSFWNPILGGVTEVFAEHRGAAWVRGIGGLGRCHSRHGPSEC